MVLFPVPRSFTRALLWPLQAAVSSLLTCHVTPQTTLVMCYLKGKGELMAFWPGRPPAEPLYFVADRTQVNPLAQDCPQLVIPGDCPVFVQICLMPKPSDDEEGILVAEGFQPVTISRDPEQPELMQVCDRLAEVIELRAPSVNGSRRTKENDTTEEEVWPQPVSENGSRQRELVVSMR